MAASVICVRAAAGGVREIEATFQLDDRDVKTPMATM